MWQRSLSRLRQAWCRLSRWKRAVAVSFLVCFVVQCVFVFSLRREYLLRKELAKRATLSLEYNPRQLAMARSLSRFVRADVLALLAPVESVTINRAVDYDLAGIAQLPRLRYLTILDGSLSTVGLNRIGSLPKLEELYLENDCVEALSLDKIPDCSKLRRLKIVGRMTPQALRSLQQSFSITELHLNSHLASLSHDVRAQSSGLNSISRPHLAIVARIPNLKTLQVDSSTLRDSDLDPLADAERLEELFVREVRLLTRSLNALGKIPYLKRLALDLDMAGYPDALEGFPHLTTLSVHGSRISPEFLRGLEKLPQLETLSFERCFVNESLFGLAGNSKLKRLNFNASDATVEGVRRIAQLASLEILDMPGFQDDQEFLDVFPNLRARVPFDWEAATQKTTWNVSRYPSYRSVGGMGFF